MLCDVVFIREERTNAAKLQNALAAVQNGKLINGRKVFAELLVVETVRNLTPTAFAGVIGG